MLNAKALGEWQVDLSLKIDDVNLTTCDREPIHIPGAIQPHGALLVLEPSSLEIIQLSANVEDILGLSIEQLLGSSLEQWFETEPVNKLRSCLEQTFDGVNPLSFQQASSDKQFNGIAHRSGETIILELEPTKNQKSTSFFDFYDYVKAPLDQLQRTQTIDEICELLTCEIKRICGFDRVMVYRFDADGSGSVIAEAHQDDLEPFLGLHYPDSDIPRQAKLLYLHNRLRIIPNCTYEPAPLVPALNPISQTPTNLSSSVLRSVSPLHLEYLENMEVTASMSISLVQEGNLWGLIACHHTSPHQVDYELRTVCEFIGQVAALEIAAKERKASQEARLLIEKIQADLINKVAQAKDVISDLAQPELLSLVNASGVVIIRGDKQISLGETPTETQINELAHHLRNRMKNEVVYKTNWLSSFHLNAEDYCNIGSGLLALCISRIQRVYILWFRQERSQTIHWGGNPNEKLTRDETGNIGISPRKSFAKWTEIVQGKSHPWLSYEIESVRELRTNILSLLLQNADELVSINKELSRSNDELDAFAYIASHDLKEPLRGIYNYSSFLIEDYAEQLDEAGNHKLQTLMRLTKRMENLIDSLLHFSRLERSELNIEKISLPQLLAEILETFEMSQTTIDAEIIVADNLPEIKGDRIQLQELYSNLISNAIKYNTAELKRIEIGVLQDQEARAAITAQGLEQETASSHLLYVRDNGIGIRQQHLTSIFRIFKRLHAAKRYGGGTGAGLTIVKKIVERHGGVIWIDSVYGVGSTFYFTIA